MPDAAGSHTDRDAAAPREKLPIDQLRDGSLTDGEIIALAAATIRANEAMHSPTRALWDAMAARLELVRLIDHRQQRKPWLYGGERV